MICYKCKGSGFIVATHLQKKSIYTFACDNCGASRLRGYSERIPKWADKLRPIYEPDFYFVIPANIQAPKRSPELEARDEEDL